jgi:hypothetical protein
MLNQSLDVFRITMPTGKDHIQRIDYNRVPNKFLHYRPHGKRSLGKPLKRWNNTVIGHLA